MALELAFRLRRPVALVVAALFLFGSAGKVIAGVECHPGAEGDHDATHGGGHHAAANDASEHDHERDGGTAPCDCLDFCQLSSYPAAENVFLEPVHIEAASEPATHPASSFVTRPPYFLPYPNGPPVI